MKEDVLDGWWKHREQLIEFAGRGGKLIVVLVEVNASRVGDRP